jgi:hypothetical protein
MKKVPAKSGAVNLEMPSTERRKELRKDPGLANSLDEEVWITRSRLSALNGVMNTILVIDGEKKLLRHVVGQLCWGVFGIELNKDTEKAMKINRKNIEDTATIAAFLDSIPSQDFHKMRRDEDTGLHWGFASRNGKLLGGLARLKKTEAYVSLLAAFAITGLNEKLLWQLQHVTKRDDRRFSDRAHLLARLANKIPNEDLEE